MIRLLARFASLNFHMGASPVWLTRNLVSVLPAEDWLVYGRQAFREATWRWRMLWVPGRRSPGRWAPPSSRAPLLY